MNNSVQINPINQEFHTRASFKEQMSVLYLDHIEDDCVVMLRSFLTVGQPGYCSFDDSGLDTPAGWAKIDSLIEKEGVRGTFHTHPSGFDDFSSQDRKAQIGLAQVNGKKLIWHGMQPVDNEDSARILCCHMLDNVIYYYDFGWIKTKISDAVLYLPLPPRIKSGRFGKIPVMSLICDSD